MDADGRQLMAVMARTDLDYIVTFNYYNFLIIICKPVPAFQVENEHFKRPLI